MTFTGPLHGPDGLCAAFNEAAHRYRCAFPEFLKNLTVTTLEEPIYVAPEIADFLHSHIARIKDVIEARAKFMRERHLLGFAGHPAVGLSRRPVSMISIDPAMERAIYVSKKYPTRMNALGVFDHEIGHLVVYEGNPLNSSAHIAECTADAFAALRHLQRFGDTTDFFENAVYNRAGPITARNSYIHYTSAAIAQVAALWREKKLDIKNMSLQETARLAGMIGRTYSHSEATLKKIYDAYAPLHAVYTEPEEDPKKDWSAIARAFAMVMQEHKGDPDIYRAGKLYMTCPYIKEHLDPVIAAAPDLAATFRTLEQHEKDTGFILDPTKAMDAKRVPFPYNALQTRPK